MTNVDLLRNIIWKYIVKGKHFTMYVAAEEKLCTLTTVETKKIIQLLPC